MRRSGHADHARRTLAIDPARDHLNTETYYTRWARETFAAEKATIDRLGMSAKS